MESWASTGLNGLDKVLCGINKGDNIVWQVDSIEDYRHFVTPYVKKALQDGRKVIYMRFAKHEPLLEAKDGITVYQLHSTVGFEAFSTQVHNIISDEGFEAYYVFDCLSDLLYAWATDMMVGNFFLVTCPYLFELDTIAYFAILRNYHSFKTIARIRETTQLLLDVYDFEGKFYVHPLKVWNRYSPTMFLPHIQQEETFPPIISSMDATKLFSHITGKGLEGSARTLDYWDRLFMDAEGLLKQPAESDLIDETVSQLCKIMVGREQRIRELAQSKFSLQDLVNINKRLVGSGFIGGKAAGMLLAQNILYTDTDFDWREQMEPHDSFYVGSDIFYSYIIENGWWMQLMKQKTKEGYFKLAPEMKENMLKGKFPDEVQERFREMIEYFGQSPIIVRSSSLLEDSFGNAFAGKYESIFLVNQGGPESCYKQFEDAVRKVYASTMGEDALMYRLKRGLDQHDEQMALLVQRVSGSYKKQYFFPDLAGVGVSYNTFAWEPDLDPKAGMLRLVLGLGTRAVDRVEDDYPQTIALDEPLLRPYSKNEDAMKFSQHNVDLLDINQNSLATISFDKMLEDDLDIRLELVATRDHKAEKRVKQIGLKNREVWSLTFEKLLSKTDFTETMRKMLKTLEKYYKYPVDIEFTVNFTDEDNYKINLVQCRPLQTKGLRPKVEIPENIPTEKILFNSCGYTMGGNICQAINRVIYVEPEEYIQLTLTEKYDIARLVGELNRQLSNKDAMPTLLFGPGRWGTTTPSLGVPVNFSEINNVTVLAEVAYEGANLMPDLSFGTHFFQDLVEGDIFYVALFPKKEDVTLNKELLEKMPNKLADLMPKSEKYAHVVKVYDTEKEKLQIMCDILSQKVVCMFG